MSNLESTSDLGSENNNGVQDDSSCTPRSLPVIPGLEESILCLSNIALHGVILMVFLCGKIYKDVQLPLENTSFKTFY